MIQNQEPSALNWFDRLSLPSLFRHERKFTIDASNRQEVLHAIKLHPAFFREIFHLRQVNNVYFDTPDLAFYLANKIGIAKRKKVRVRWYGDTFGNIEKPKLEFKLKAGLVGDKWTFRLPMLEIDGELTQHSLQHFFARANLPQPILTELKNLSPTLLNTYQRSYFLSADKKFRLTFDEALTYYRIDKYFNAFAVKRKTPNHFILELKYGLDQDESADQISKHFRFRMDKSSKYVNGIDLLR